MSGTPIERLLGYPGRDPGCDEGFAQLDQYCDAVRRGENVAERFAGLLIHIANCPACREDTEGMLAALDDLERPKG
jgi:hypothetical protein